MESSADTAMASSVVKVSRVSLGTGSARCDCITLIEHCAANKKGACLPLPDQDCLSANDSVASSNAERKNSLSFIYMSICPDHCLDGQGKDA